MADPSRVRLVDVPGLAPVPYSYAAVTTGPARVVHLAGSCPLDADGRVVAPGDVAGQARRCLQNLAATLAAVGATPSDVTFVRALVASTDRAALAVVWDAVRQAFAEHRVPGTLQGVTVLGWPDQLVEIEAVAALPADRSAD